MSQKNRHPSLVRLLEFVKDQGISGPSALASAMQETEQVITNWGSRGVSMVGALKAEERFGCPAGWILKGTAKAPPAPETAPDVQGCSFYAGQLAKLFDDLPDDRIKRLKVYQACTQLLLEALQPDVPPPSAEPLRPASAKRQRA